MGVPYIQMDLLSTQLPKLHATPKNKNETNMTTTFTIDHDKF